MFAHRLDISLKQRVTLYGRGSEFGVKLYRHKPGMSGEFDDFDQIAVHRRAGDYQAFFLQCLSIVIVELIAVTMDSPFYRRCGAR